MTALLRRIRPEDAARSRAFAIDAATMRDAAAIIADVRQRGSIAVKEHAERLGDIAPGKPLTIGTRELKIALDALEPSARRVLEDARNRITVFADAQRNCLKELEIPVPGGSAGHWIAPMARAGCYAPGGRFPLPSSVLMTACTARAAGVREVLVASPHPTREMLAAAALAGADAFLCVGGAQAIAAMALGAGDIRRCDIIVGPGNRWVTAAKKLVAGEVAIDMLAGPSEVLVIADDTADPSFVAADLLAQAEHDTDAVPILVTTHAPMVDLVNAALEKQLADLSTAPTARCALQNGYAVVCADIAQAVVVSDALAPEHLEIQTRDAREVARKCTHYGAIFIGGNSAEVFGDYGLGPNHVLPTAGTARAAAGLSVFNFLRVRTFLEMDAQAADSAIIADIELFARMEGLEGHARAAHVRALPR